MPGVKGDMPGVKGSGRLELVGHPPRLVSEIRSRKGKGAAGVERGDRERGAAPCRPNKRIEFRRGVREHEVNRFFLWKGRNEDWFKEGGWMNERITATHAS
jgi:hypothetical protein